MRLNSATDRPRWWEWSILGILIFESVLFGVLVVYRSAIRPERLTDFEVYARAGWAVSTDRDIYEVTDPHGLHYCYPPTFAALIAPLADPPPGEPRTGYLPFIVSVTIWYVLSLAALVTAVHILANAVERSSNPVPARGSRRWWWLRVAPVVFTLPAIGSSLSHGQANLILLLLICGALAAALAGRTGTAAAWLAGAIALKVFPAFLALIPIRRPARWVVGIGAGLAVFLFGIPALILGPTQTIEANFKFVDVMLGPALGAAEASDRSREMFDVLRTDNQSIQAVLHAWQNIGCATPQAQPGPRTLATHWLIGVALTALTLANARRRRLRGNDLLLLAGALSIVMLLISPMCHLHYYCLALPLILALLHDEWQHRDGMWMGRRLAAMLALHVVGIAFPLIFEQYRNLGFAPLATLPLLSESIRRLNHSHIEGQTLLPFMPAVRRKAV